MSDPVRIEFALQEPAMAIAPVFLALPKGNRKKLDVTCRFGDAALRWRGPDALGMPEQSVMLGLLCIAAQQYLRMSRASPQKLGAELLRRLCLSGADMKSEFVVLQTSWNKLVAAAGYRDSGGEYVKLVQAAVERLAETTMWEIYGDEKYESRLLSYIKGSKDGVTILLNHRATEALCGGQYVKISLVERHALRCAPAKALHAWLSGCVRAGGTLTIAIGRLQGRVWGAEATGSTLRSRLATLREALAEIGKLPGWRCDFPNPHLVDMTRVEPGSIANRTTKYRRASGSIADGQKTAGTKEKGAR